MYFASKAGRNYREFEPFWAGQTHQKATAGRWNPALRGSSAGNEHHVAANSATVQGCLSGESLLVFISLPWQIVVVAIS